MVDHKLHYLNRIGRKNQKIKDIREMGHDDHCVGNKMLYYYVETKSDSFSHQEKLRILYD